MLTPRPMFRPTGSGDMGQVGYRSGWAYVMTSLAPWMSDAAQVLLDDNVDGTFFLSDEAEAPVHRTPWIGICHNPVSVPFELGLGLKHLDNMPAWRESLPHLKLLVVLTAEAAPWVEKLWGVPTLALRHPTDPVARQWSPEAFRLNPSRKLVQIGLYLRNPDAIAQAPVPAWLEKARVNLPNPWAWKLEERYRKVFAHRPSLGVVTQIPHLDADAYDRLLSENVVFLELLQATANNTVIECIARATPVVVNRLPGPEWYLGKDYPLFYDDIGEVEALLTPERILEAHAYLKRLPKDWLSGEAFARALAEGCLKAVPELWGEG